MINLPDNNEPTPLALLRDLLHLLYPDSDSLNPDILRWDDYERRYQFTELGPLAVAAIERAQRMTRAIGNFEDIGLCAFHIGLIYFHHQDYRGAAQQFLEARQQWSFVDKTAAVCLAYFAEGLGHQHAHAYETAVIRYGKAEKTIPRIQFEPSPNSRNQFIEDLQTAIHAAQEISREALEEQTAVDDEPASDSEPPEKSETVSNVETAVESNAPPSAITLPPPSYPSPIPGHTIDNDQHTWYRAHILRQDDLFPEAIKERAWLLVKHKTPNHNFKKGDLLVIGSADQDASVSLKPFQSDAATEHTFPRIYLARTESEGTFTMEAGRAQFSSNLKQTPFNYDDLLGHVVGLWLESGDFEILGNGS